MPKSSSAIAASRFSSTANIALGASPLRHFGEPDLPPARARVKCGLNARSSRGMPSSPVVRSILSASSASSGPAWIPIQNTRGAFAEGKNPYPHSANLKRAAFDPTQVFRNGRDLLRPLFSNELKRNVQRLRPHPPGLRCETLHAVKEARNAGANFRIEIDADKYSHVLCRTPPPVILSEAETSRSEVSAESKDPYSTRVQGILARLPAGHNERLYMSALRIISNACWVENCRMRFRSPRKFLSTTCVPSSPASAM